MRFRRSKTFKKCFEELPDGIKQAAKESFRLFSEHPHYPYHPSLRIKPMKGYPGIWEGHVTLEYVFTFHRETNPETGEITVVFRKIGKHDIYKKP